MANLGKIPGDDTSAPVESRRTTSGEIDPGQVSPELPAAEEPTAREL